MSARTTAKRQASIVCEYWYRMVMEDTNVSIEDIVGIMVLYYDIYIAYHGKFLKENCGEGFKILSDDKIRLEEGLDGECSAKLDQPILMDQNMIYCWDIIVTTAKWFTFDEIIGVVSDKCDNIGVDVIDGLIDIHGISLCNGYVWEGTYHDYPEGHAFDYEIESGMVIRCELDCKLSAITFKHEEETIHCVKLPERKAWYPAVHGGFDSYGYVFKFVPTNF